MIRILLFVIVIVTAVIAPTIIFAVCALFYALKYTAYELIIVAASIDAYYSTMEYPLIPYYTLIVCFSLILIEWIKPRISVYNQ